MIGGDLLAGMILTGLAAGEAGPPLVVAFAINGFITIFNGMVYAELGSAIPETVGERFGGRVLMVKEHRPIGGTVERWWSRWFGSRRG